MLTRPLSLKLLAPTVLVSLLLVVTCIFSLLYLNRLQWNVSIHTEHIESTLAADELETRTLSVIKLLRGDHGHPETLRQDLDQRSAGIVEQLNECKRLANLDREKELVAVLAAGVQEYQKRYAADPISSMKKRDAELARLLEERVLQPCRELRQFNTGQVGASDHENTVIVNRLTWVLLAVALGAPLGGLWLGYTVARGLYRSLYQLSVRIRDAAGRLADELPPVVLDNAQELPDLHRQLQGITEEIEKVVKRLQQREHEMLRAEQLAAVGQVAAGVAHELRNPLTSVMMLVQTGLEGPKATGLPPEDLVIIEREVRRMESCIQAFLDFGRPPTGQRCRTDLAAVVRRAVALVESRARRQKVVLGAQLPAEPVELDLDAEQIHQVLVNLLLNSLDALPHGGKIEVRLIPPTPEMPQTTVEVADDGPGISPQLRERIFEPFVSGKETGVGLGLSICRRLVEDHGGRIQGDNAAGGGPVFRFALPAS